MRNAAMKALLGFDGRVVVVTGAGGGLGRAHALEFASRGAMVVVNDLGGGAGGEGKSSSPADGVVDEIKRAGGRAVADYNSVEDGAAIVDTALGVFGRLDVLVNNAGILRDRTFGRMSDEDWERVQAVHVKGVWRTTKAAWTVMMKQNYGRIVMTASASGLYGNRGQANYSAAKMAQLGLANSLAIEGAKYNINVNTIAPIAASRMTENLMPEEILSVIKPELVSPLVSFLCHDTCDVTGAIFEVGGGWAGAVRLQQSPGVVLADGVGRSFSAEDVKRRWDEINDYTNALNVGSIHEATARLMPMLEKSSESSSPEDNADANASSNSSSTLSDLKGIKFEATKFQIDSKDLILYALGVGAKLDDADEFRFLYENSDSFAAFPSFSVVPQIHMLRQLMDRLTDAGVDPYRILHGEQRIVNKAPFPISGVVRNEGVVEDVLDKGSGAVIVLRVDTFDERDRLVTTGQFVIFAVGYGGFGGRRDSEVLPKPFPKPSSTPDAVVEERVPSGQAALYRLSGDSNPLHVDSTAAAVLGFNRPILHGLCSFAFSLRHVIKTFANDETHFVGDVRARFSKPFYPGQTLVTRMWKEQMNQGMTRVHFETSCKEMNQNVIIGAYVDIMRKDVKEEKLIKSKL